MSKLSPPHHSRSRPRPGPAFESDDEDSGDEKKTETKPDSRQLSVVIDRSPSKSQSQQSPSSAPLPRVHGGVSERVRRAASLSSLPFVPNKLKVLPASASGVLNAPSSLQSPSSKAHLESITDFIRNFLHQKVPELSQWIFMPDSLWKGRWDMFVLVVLLVNVFVLPFQLAFPESTDRDPFDTLLDFVWLTDILLTFFTAVETWSGSLIVNHRQIAILYLSSWFAPDCLAIFPFDLIFQHGQLTNIARAFKLILLRKLIRSNRFQYILLSIEYSPIMNQNVFRIGRLIAILLSLAHFAACLWFFVGQTQLYTGVSWEQRVFPDTSVASLDRFSQYIVSLYWATTTMTGIGFGDITPRTSTEIIACMCFMLIGATYFSYFVGTIISMVTLADRNDIEYRDSMNGLVKFLAERRAYLSLDTQANLTKAMAHEWGKSYSDIARTNFADVCSKLDDQVRSKLADEMYQFFATHNPFLKQFAENSNFVRDFFERGHNRECQVGEIIASCEEKDSITAVYFVRRGIVDGVYTPEARKDTPVYKVFREGSIVGLPALLKKKWPFWVRCRSSASLWFFPRENFGELLKAYDLQQQFEDLAKEDWKDWEDTVKQSQGEMLRHMLARASESAAAAIRQKLLQLAYESFNRIQHPVDLVTSGVRQVMRVLKNEPEAPRAQLDKVSSEEAFRLKQQELQQKLTTEPLIHSRQSSNLPGYRRYSSASSSSMQFNHSSKQSSLGTIEEPADLTDHFDSGSSPFNHAARRQASSMFPHGLSGFDQSSSSWSPASHSTASSRTSSSLSFATSIPLMQFSISVPQSSAHHDSTASSQLQTVMSPVSSSSKTPMNASFSSFCSDHVNSSTTPSAGGDDSSSFSS